MSGWSEAFEQEEAEDNVDEESKEYKSKDAVIFLVDSAPSMFKATESGEINFQNVMKLCSNFLKDKIISARKDLVGLCFYNTVKSKNSNGFDGIFVFHDLDEPDAAFIKSVERVSESKRFNEDVGSNDKSAQFYHALWACASLFSERELKDTSKRIFLFTDNDEPEHNSDLRSKAIQKAKDLEDLDITIELFPLTRPDTKFDPRKFYKEIIVIEADEDIGKLSMNFSSKFEDLQVRFRKKEYKKRALGSITLQLKEGIEVAVKMYCLAKEVKPEYASFLDLRTNHPLTCVTKWICKHTSAQLEDHQIRKYQLYGGEKVYFTKEEMNTIKSFGSPGLVLMGFKPMSSLKVYENIKAAYFIYPDESRIKGSTVCFAALLTEMVNMGKIAIARFIYRKATVPRFVALVPQKESFDKDGVQTAPPGFHLIFLPYADDIRNLKLAPTPIADESLIEKAKKVVHDLQIKFDSSKFENPALQKHYAAIQALALDEKEVEVDDLVQPHQEGMEKFKDDIIAFRTAIFGDAETESEEKKPKRKTASKRGGSESKTSKKRKASDKEKAGSKKKAKAEEAEEAEEGEEEKDWPGLVKTGEISKLTIPNLKIYLKKHGLPVSGKKAELVERIRTHIQGGDDE